MQKIKYKGHYIRRILHAGHIAFGILENKAGCMPIKTFSFLEDARKWIDSKVDAK